MEPHIQLPKRTISTAQRDLSTMQGFTRVVSDHLEAVVTTGKLTIAAGRSSGAFPAFREEKQGLK